MTKASCIYHGYCHTSFEKQNKTQYFRISSQLQIYTSFQKLRVVTDDQTRVSLFRFWMKLPLLTYTITMDTVIGSLLNPVH